MKSHILSIFIVFLLGVDFLYAQEITSGKADLSAINVLLIDGQGTHNWRETTPVLERTLEETGLFDVTVTTTPPEWESVTEFAPNFADYDVILLNYGGALWSETTQAALLQYVADGGGLVLYHSANHAFPEWKEFQNLLAVTAWGGRNADFGPYRYWEPQMRSAVQLAVDGPTGSAQNHVEYVIQSCMPTHPIMRGVSEKMLHGPDELYAHLRGPVGNAQKIALLAVAHSDSETGGSGRWEAVLATTNYGKGRVFQILYGHSGSQCRSVAFIVPFLRGTQWAATGVVTIPVPEDIPTEDKSYIRP